MRDEYTHKKVCIRLFEEALFILSPNWKQPKGPSTDKYSAEYSCLGILLNNQFSSVQLCSSIQLFVTPWTAARQASLSINNSPSPPKPMSTESVMPSNHLILCRPLLLSPSIFPNIRVFSNELVLRIRWPKYWSFSFSISPSNEYSGLISFRMDWLISFQSKGLSRVFSSNKKE